MPKFQKPHAFQANQDHLTESPDAIGLPANSASNSSAYRKVVDGGYQLILVKHEQRYVFRYAPGEENNVLKGLIEMVNDPDTDIDWFDAAIVSHQLGLRMGQTLDQITGKKTA